MSVLHALRQDARFAHRLRYSDREPTTVTRARVVLGSRGLLVTALHRVAFEADRRRAAGEVGVPANVFMRLSTITGRLLSAMVAKCQVAGRTVIEEGVFLSDRGHIILGARSIGSGTVIHHDVTIGMHPVDRGLPEIGRRVWIGPGALVYGNIRIGDGATVLPDTVLSKSVPDRAVVRGNPARIVGRDFDNAPLFRSLGTDVAHLVERAAHEP
jgi:serine acetyltransferase